METAGLSWLCDHADMGLHGNRVQLGSLGEFFFSPSFERINAKARRRKECSTPVGWHASGPPPHTHQSAGLCPQGKHFLWASWCVRNSLI